MLDGQGADEILAGYHGVYDLRLLELGRKLRLVAALRFATQRARMQNVPVPVQMRLLAAALAQSGPAIVRVPLGAAAWLRRKGRAIKGVSVAPWLEAQSFDTEKHYDVFQRAVADAKLPAPSGIGDLCSALTTVGNVRMLLHWEDRNSMAHGVEARVPFLDHPLVEFAIALGGEHKLVDGWTKWILRKSMKGRLPDAVRERKDKLGFATPETEWMRGPLRAEYRDAVLATQKRFPEHFPRPALTAMVDDMLDGRRPMEFAPWRVACFGIWSERFGTSF
jgi:asparagine synthase (glutamine-hydrolysing)